MVQNLHNKSILNIIKGVLFRCLMKMGNYRRVVYEEKGDLSPETRKGRKINYDLDILQADTRSREKLLVFKEDNEKLYTPKQALNYLKEFKNLKDDKDLHKASYTAAIQVILRFCRCYDGKINGKLLPTLSALKKFESKYPQYGKVKGLFSRETLLALEKYLAANEKHLNTKYAYEDENGGKKKAREVLNISVKELFQKQKNTSNASNSSHTSQSQQTSQNSSRTSTSSSSSNFSSSTQSSSTTSKSNSSSNSSSINASSNSSSSYSNSSTPSPNPASTSTPSNEKSTNPNTNKKQADTQTQPVEKGKEGSQTVVKQPESKTGESPTLETPKTEKTQEELEREEIKQGKEALQKALNTINTTLTSYQQKLNNLQNTINSLQSSSNIPEQQQIVDQQRQVFLKTKNDLENKIVELQQEQTNLSNQLSTLLKKEKITRVDIQTIKNQLTHFQTQVDTFVRQANKLIKDVDLYQKGLIPERPSGTISPMFGQYFRALRTFQQKQDNLPDKPDLCTSYALTASTEMLKQQGKILPPMSEASAWNLTKISGIDKAFTINTPTTSEDIKKQILEAPAGSIMTVRYARNEHYRGTDQPESRGVSHTMVSLGNRKYTDLISDNQRTIDLNNITIQSDPTWGFIFTDKQGRSFQFVTKTERVTEGSGSSILTPKESLKSGQQTTFDFDQLWAFHNITLNKDVVADFEASGQALTNKIDAFAKQYHLDFSYVKDNVLVKKQNGKYNFNFKSKDIPLFVAWIRGYTGYGNNFIREKLYEQGMDWMKGGSPAGKRITLPSVNVPKKMTNQTNPGGNGNGGNTGGTGERGKENEAKPEVVKTLGFTLKQNPTVSKYESIKSNVEKVYNTLKNNKTKIMEVYKRAGISNQDYDEVAKRVMGIIYKESTFGTGIRYYFYGNQGNSRGISQVNRYSRTKEGTDKPKQILLDRLHQCNIYGIDDFKNIEKGTIGTMIIALQGLIQLSGKKQNKDSEGKPLIDTQHYPYYDYLYYIWNRPKSLDNGHKWITKKENSDPEVYDHPQDWDYRRVANSFINKVIP